MKTYSRFNKVQHDSINLIKHFINSCRLCLNNVPITLSIDINIKDKIKFCVGLEIANADCSGLPSKLCENCFKTVTSFYSFKKMCISNELKLQEFKVPRNTFTHGEDDETKYIECPKNVNRDDISLIQENGNTLSVLLEEENIHPDAPYDAFFQIKRNYAESQSLTEDISQIVLGEVYTNDNAVKSSTEYPVRSKEILPRSYACRECNVCFSRTDRLILHEKQVHNIQRFYCSHCSKSFVSKILIERHMRTHTGHKPFQCNICAKTFSQKESMNRHIARLHCEKKYECEKCPKVFTSSEGLKSHYFTHHTVRTNEDLYRYKCKFCTKSFCHSSGLSRHLLTHTGVIFTCKICQKGFSDGSCLRRHSLIVHQLQNHRFEVGLVQQMPSKEKNLITENLNNGKSGRSEQTSLPYG